MTIYLQVASGLVAILGLPLAVYLFYNEKRREQGWVTYMREYCCRGNFRREWKELGSQFDTDFVDFVDKLMKESVNSASV